MSIKREQQLPLYFQRHSLCSVIDLRTEFNIITFPLSCFLILIFSIKIKNVASEEGCCLNRYIAVPLPLDFFAHVKRTFAAVIFAIYADELLSIANELLNGSNAMSNQGCSI